jgi:hypothetical protein
MNFKLKDRILLNGDIVSPEIPYAVFDEGLSKDVMKRILLILNYGNQLLLLYKEYRNSFHIVNIVKMLEKMESIFQKYDQETYAIQKEKSNV